MKPYRMDELGFECPPLPWRQDALEPILSAEAIRLHYELHHGYCERLARDYEWQAARDPSGGASLPWGLAERVRRTGRRPTLEQVAASTETNSTFPSLEAVAAQAWNHAFQWLCLRPDGPRSRPTSPDMALRGTALGRRIAEGKVEGEKLEDALFEKAGLFMGSGWLWLSSGPDGDVRADVLEVAGNPLQFGRRPLFVLDLWEHAFLLDYDGDRADYVRRVVRELADWQFVAARYDGRA